MDMETFQDVQRKIDKAIAPIYRDLLATHILPEEVTKIIIDGLSAYVACLARGVTVNVPNV